MYTGMFSRGFKHCFNCNCEIVEKGANKNMLYADGKKHFTCSECVAKMEAPVVEPPQEAPKAIMVQQCSCGNIAVSDTIVNGLCIPCQRKQEAQETAEPFKSQDVVKFIPMYAQEFVSTGKTHALILNCLNYGTVANPNWAVDVQFLKETGSEQLQLTPVRAYMVASWQVEKINRPWARY